VAGAGRQAWHNSMADHVALSRGGSHHPARVTPTGRAGSPADM